MCLIKLFWLNFLRHKTTTDKNGLLEPARLGDMFFLIGCVETLRQIHFIMCIWFGFGGQTGLHGYAFTHDAAVIT